VKDGSESRPMSKKDAVALCKLRQKVGEVMLEAESQFSKLDVVTSQG
jgi:hypothetical protein